MAFQLLAVRGCNDNQILHPGVNPHDRSTGFHMRWRADATRHDARQRHQPADLLEPHCGP